MVPAAIVLLDALPLTSSGKLDLAALPQPNAAARQPAHPHELPRTAVERALSSLWERLLHARVGIWDNFFEVGGDSLRALQLLDQIETDFGIAIPLYALHQDAANIAGMASRIDGAVPPPDTIVRAQRRVAST